MTHSKTCSICGESFEVNKYRPNQQVCSKPECQHKRQIDNMRVWRKGNPEYFKGMYPILKEKHKNWRKNNKEYLKKYRNAHKDRYREYMKIYMKEYRRKLKEKKEKQCSKIENL